MTALERCLEEQRQCLRELKNPNHSKSTRFLIRMGLEDWVKEEVYLMAEMRRATTPEAREMWATVEKAAQREPVQMRLFDTGATRNVDESKPDYEGFLSPAVVKRFGEYMHKHRVQADGALRDSDNWQKGIPRAAYMKSLWRHVHDVWMYHRGLSTVEPIEEALCAVIFNTQGYLQTLLKERGYGTQTAAQAETKS